MKKWEKAIAIILAIVGIWFFAGFFKIIPIDSKYSSLRMMCEFGKWYHTPKTEAINIKKSETMGGEIRPLSFFVPFFVSSGG